MVAALNEVALGTSAILTKTRYDALCGDRPRSHEICKVFGSWSNALVHAGLSHRLSDRAQWLLSQTAS